MTELVFKFQNGNYEYPDKKLQMFNKVKNLRNS